MHGGAGYTAAPATRRRRLHGGAGYTGAGYIDAHTALMHGGAGYTAAPATRRHRLHGGTGYTAAPDTRRPAPAGLCAARIPGGTPHVHTAGGQAPRARGDSDMGDSDIGDSETGDSDIGDSDMRGR
jgi:hypothetical protein